MSFLNYYKEEKEDFWKKLHGTLWDGTKIYIVDGNYVRSDIKGGIEFVEGGHSLVYKWMPPNEIWVEKMININDQADNMLHECYEWTIMKYHHENYDKAHEKANNVELLIRKNYKEGK